MMDLFNIFFNPLQMKSQGIPAFNEDNFQYRIFLCIV